MIARCRIREFRFVNQHGERWHLEIDLDSQIGWLTGDELGGEQLEIIEGEIGDDFIFNDEEYRWLAQVWEEATGEQLRKPLMRRLWEELAEWTARVKQRPAS